MLQLLEQAPVRRVLTKLIDKASRDGNLEASLVLDKRVLPEIFNAESGEDADFCWSLIKDIQAQGLIQIALKKTKGPCAEYEQAPRVSLGTSLENLRARMGMGAPTPSYRDTWRHALSTRLHAPLPVAASLESFNVSIEGRTAIEVVEGLNRLLTLRNKPLLLREASSYAFWGQSKVLDGRTAMVARLFEMDECPFPSAPVQLSVRLPEASLRGVLFVENVTTFESLAAANDQDTAGFALIYSAGARATAKRLVVRGSASLFYARSVGYAEQKALAVEALLFEGASALPAFFFGDLDFAGMSILKGLRENFPAITAWQPGYDRLLARLESADSHQARAADKTGQSDPGVTGCPYADQVLLPAMRTAGAFVDQE